MTVWIEMFWVHDRIVTVCRMQRCGVADCSIVEHQPQWKLGLQQLNTATGGHLFQSREGEEVETSTADIKA